jgi:hypothetical protein
MGGCASTIATPNVLMDGHALPASDSTALSHVMFSYNWDHQALVLQVVALLKSNGVDVWADVLGSSCLGKMAGSTDEVMIKVPSSNSVCATLPYTVCRSYC